MTRVLGRPSLGAGISTVVLTRLVRRSASIPIGPTASGTRIQQPSTVPRQPLGHGRHALVGALPTRALVFDLHTEFLAEVQTEVLDELLPAGGDRPALRIRGS